MFFVILSYAMVIPVSGFGFRDWSWTSFGRRLNANVPKTGPELPGPSARAVWDGVSVRSYYWVGLMGGF